MKSVSTACLLTTVAAMAMTVPAFAQTEAPASAAPVADAAAPAAPAATAQVETNAAPGSQDAQTAAAAAAAASRELPPVLPTTGDGAVIVNLLSNICQPVIKGGDFAALVKAQKLKLDRKTGQYVVPLSGKPYQITLYSPGVNKNVCEMTVRYAIGADQPIIDALNIWRFLHQPQMVLRRNDIGNYADVQRVTTTWDNWANQMVDGAFYGLVAVQTNKLDGTPSLDPKFDEINIKYSVRPPVQPMVTATGEATTAELEARKAAEAAAAAAAAGQAAPAAPATEAAPAAPAPAAPAQ